jgi:A/G-specific adenine glycosylase
LDVFPLLVRSSPQQVRAFRRLLLNWYRRHGRDLPWRRTHDPYAILVSEFMLQQTQVATVLPYYNKWLRRFPDFTSLARASEDAVLQAWQGLGYYARARNLHATAKAIAHQHGRHFPRCVEQMQQLPGIGKYTAHAVATFAFDQPVAILEANTVRVVARLFDYRKPIDSGAGVNTLWQYAAMLVPKSTARNYNSALTDLGALVCLPRNPKCTACPVRRFCRTDHPEALPVKRSRPRIKREIEKHAFVVDRGKILLQQSSTRWRGMWILPRLELAGFKPSGFRRRAVYTSVFPFTNHRVALKVYAQRGRGVERRNGESATATSQLQRWIGIDLLESIPMPSPHRRAVRHLLNESGATQPPVATVVSIVIGNPKRA